MIVMLTMMWVDDDGSSTHSLTHSIGGGRKLTRRRERRENFTASFTIFLP